MILLAAWIALVLALLTSASAVVQGALDYEGSEKSESVGFIRLTITGLFGVVVGQALTPIASTWYVAASGAVGLTLLLLFLSQVAAKTFGQSPVGRKLLRFSAPMVNSLHLLFTPISLPKLEVPEEFEQELLDSVEEFGETIVREIMVPRIDMATVDADDSLSKSMAVFLSRGYSRLPVVGKNIDDIRGILYLKDVARILHESPSKIESTSAADISRPAIYVPESKPVDDLLREMQVSSTHIAVIVDEYGGVAGLATMEDVIEEIVGDISDEYDRVGDAVEHLGQGVFRVKSGYSLAELGELLDLELEDEDVDSIGGLFTKELGRLPSPGDKVLVAGLSIKADRIEGRRKRLITVILEKNQNLNAAEAAFEQIEKGQ